MTTSITLVLFDVGNVILRSTHRITDAILWDLGVRPDRVPLFFHNSAYGEFARGRITGRDFAARVSEALELELTESVVRTAHDAHIYGLDEDVHRGVVDLCRRSRPVGFVTTTNVWQTGRERELVDLARFGTVVRSHEIGMTKTDPDAWPRILEAWPEHRPKRVLLIDDSRANIDAACRAGLQGLLFDTRYYTGATLLFEALRARGLLEPLRP